MSTDEPTRPLPPNDPRVGVPPPRPAVPLAAEPVLVEPDPYWRQDVIDRLASLRTALVFVGILAALALGVGVWALVEAGEEDGGPRGASSSRVSGIDERVDSLERRIDDLPTAREVRELGQAQQDLGQRVAAAEKAAGDAGAAPGDDPQVRSAITDLTQEVENLDGRIDALEQAAQNGTATP